jgi:peptidylprolyl isomerase
MPSLRLPALALPLLLAACGTDAGPDAPEAPPAPEAPAAPAAPAAPSADGPAFAPELNVDLAASTHTASGLYYRDLAVGTGEEATAGRTAAMLYTGWLTDGREFDGNMPSGPTLPFTVGAGEVIPGWDEGVAGMRVGGRRQLVIPPELAYGPNEAGMIPPNSTLVFEVELVGLR